MTIITVVEYVETRKNLVKHCIWIIVMLCDLQNSLDEYFYIICKIYRIIFQNRKDFKEIESIS